LHVATQVLLECVLLLLCLEGIVEFAQTSCRKQFGLGDVYVRFDNEVALYDFADFLLLDSSRGVV